MSANTFPELSSNLIASVIFGCHFQRHSVEMIHSSSRFSSRASLIWFASVSTSGAESH